QPMGRAWPAGSAVIARVRRAAAAPCAPPRAPAVGPARPAEMPWPAHGPAVPGAAGWPALASRAAGLWRPGWQDRNTPGSPPFCVFLSGGLKAGLHGPVILWWPAGGSDPGMAWRAHQGATGLTVTWRHRLAIATPGRA